MGEDHRDKAEEINPVSRVRRLGYCKRVPVPQTYISQTYICSVLSCLFYNSLPCR